MTWISVKDRLPEEEVSILMCNDEDIVVGCMWKHSKNGKIHWSCVDDYFGDATHWMPLPELPKEQEKETPTYTYYNDGDLFIEVLKRKEKDDTSRNDQHK